MDATLASCPAFVGTITDVMIKPNANNIITVIRCIHVFRILFSPQIARNSHSSVAQRARDRVEQEYRKATLVLIDMPDF